MDNPKEREKTAGIITEYILTLLDIETIPRDNEIKELKKSLDLAKKILKEK